MKGSGRKIMSREGTFDAAQVCKNGNPEMFLQELTEQESEEVLWRSIVEQCILGKKWS